MHRIDTSGSSAGLFKESPAPATKVGKDWLNDLQENVARAIESFGIALVKGDYDQLKTALASVGLPGRHAVTDLDALDRSGFYASSAEATGRPAGTAAGMVVSIFDKGGSADGCQLFIEVAADRLWMRRWDGDDWLAWVPAGGASGGSNANGYWEINYGSGFMRQWGVYNASLGEGAVLTPMPLEFGGAPTGFRAITKNTTSSTSFRSYMEVVSATTTEVTWYVQRDGSPPDITGFWWEVVGPAPA